MAGADRAQRRELRVADGAQLAVAAPLEGASSGIRGRLRFMCGALGRVFPSMNIGQVSCALHRTFGGADYTSPLPLQPPCPACIMGPVEVRSSTRRITDADAADHRGADAADHRGVDAADQPCCLESQQVVRLNWKDQFKLRSSLHKTADGVTLMGTEICRTCGALWAYDGRAGPVPTATSIGTRRRRRP